jgi:hypothetical protein
MAAAAVSVAAARCPLLPLPLLLLLLMGRGSPRPATSKTQRAGRDGRAWDGRAGRAKKDRANALALKSQRAQTAPSIATKTAKRKGAGTDFANRRAEQGTLLRAQSKKGRHGCNAQGPTTVSGSNWQ